jgi:hypothetical protein
MFLLAGAMNCHDRNPVRRNEMSNTIESEQSAMPAEASKPKTKRTAAKKAKPAKKAGRAKKPANKPKADRANKKAVVIALLKRAKGATLAEIMAVTKWQTRTVRGFVSILGSKCGEQIESAKNADGERAYDRHDVQD